LLKEYRDDPNMGIAGDLLSAAVTMGDRRPEILKIAEDVETKTDWPLQQRMSRNIWAGEANRETKRFAVQTIDGGQRVRELRRALALHPRNAFGWVDLALEHLVLGFPEKSRKAMGIALSLAPSHRFVLRSASALFVELGELDRALAVLQQGTKSKSDPWLVAPQVAIADLARMKQTLGRAAEHVLDADHPPMHLAELRAAFGTVQMSAGSSRRGRQLLRRILQAPTENALAQIEWSDHRIDESDPILGEMPGGVPRAFEALALRASFEAKWNAGLEYSEQWRRDQPFRVEPYIQGSFCACEAEEWELAESFSRSGLALHRNNPYLLNNRAFAQIGRGHLGDAAMTLLHARRSSSGVGERLARVATEALWLFRIGENEEGRDRYNAAIRIFTRKHLVDDAARAALMLAQEEICAGSELAEEAWRRAVGLVGKSGKGAHVMHLQERVGRLRGSSPRQIGAGSPVVQSATLIAILIPPELEHV
jgi:Flp pilus assembly protein TadD